MPLSFNMEHAKTSRPTNPYAYDSAGKMRHKTISRQTADLNPMPKGATNPRHNINHSWDFPNNQFA